MYIIDDVTVPLDNHYTIAYCSIALDNYSISEHSKFVI